MGGMAAGGTGGIATGGVGGALDGSAGRPGMDAAVLDASSPPDAPVGADAAPEPSLCPGSYPLCDGFEGPGIQDALWGLPYVEPPSLQGTLLTIDPSMHRRGRSSMRVHLPAGKKGVASMHTPVGAFKDFYARIFLFMHAAPRGGGLFAIDDPQAVEIEWDQGGVELGDLPPDLLQRPLPPRPLLPKDRWVCLLMVIKTTSSGGTAQLFIDDDRNAALTLSLTRKPMIMRAQMVFDIDVPLAGPPFDMWVDELLVSDTPIGCSN
jgi:hypothetical protein